jgi:hypothetical protein
MHLASRLKPALAGYRTAADCDAAYRDDLNSIAGSSQDSIDFLQTQAGRCVASDDSCLAR